MPINSIGDRQELIPPYSILKPAAAGLLVSIAAVASAIFSAPPVLTGALTFKAVLLIALTITLFVKSRLQTSAVVERLDASQKAPTGLIDIQSTVCGVLGRPLPERLPPYLNKIRLENGDPLSLEEKDLIVECSIWDCTLEAFPRGTVYLPIKLLSDKNFDDTISLQYEGKVVRLKLCKKYSLLPTLKDVCDSILAQQTTHPIFGTYSSDDWFKWDETACFYRWTTSADNAFVLEETAAAFKPISPCIVRSDSLSKEQGKLRIKVAEFAGFERLSDLSFVINQNEWVIYGDRTKILVSENTVPKDRLSYADKKHLKKEIPREIALRINWKLFFQCSFEEMKNKLKNVSFSLKFGQLQIIIPIAEENS